MIQSLNIAPNTSVYRPDSLFQEQMGVYILHTYIHTSIFYLLEQVIKAGSNIADVDLLVKPRDNKTDRPK